MDLSLSRLPWYAQIGAFVAVCAGAVYGFYHFYVQEVQADISIRQARFINLKADVTKGMATARRLPEFESQVTQLEQKLDGLRAVLPEEKDVADILRRIQGIAAQSNLTIQRFTPQPMVQQTIYAEVPFKLKAEGTYHDLGFFFDRISKFPRIINIADISIKANPKPEPNATIIAECTATTFVLQEGPVAGQKGKGVVPKQPSLGK